MALALSALVKCTQISADEVLWYALVWLGCVICFTVAVPPYDILEVGPRADVSENSVYYI